RTGEPLPCCLQLTCACPPLSFLWSGRCLVPLWKRLCFTRCSRLDPGLDQVTSRFTAQVAASAAGDRGSPGPPGFCPPRCERCRCVTERSAVRSPAYPDIPPGESPASWRGRKPCPHR